MKEKDEKEKEVVVVNKNELLLAIDGTKEIGDLLKLEQEIITLNDTDVSTAYEGKLQVFLLVEIPIAETTNALSLFYIPVLSLNDPGLVELYGKKFQELKAKEENKH